MDERPSLAARPRTITGKKVSLLRKAGILPANIFGRSLESLAIETDAREFGRFIRTSGIRGVFHLQVEGEPTPRSVILRDMTRKGGTGEPIHADFFQVDLTRPVTTRVPLRLEGKSPAVEDLAGTLAQNLETVVVRCLPLDIPQSISVDLSTLTTFTSRVTVADIDPGENVQLVSGPSAVIIAVSPPRARRAGA